MAAAMAACGGANNQLDTAEECVEEGCTVRPAGAGLRCEDGETLVALLPGSTEAPGCCCPD